MLDRFNFWKHKNIIGYLKALERSLEAWQEKQRYHVVHGHKMLTGTSLSEDENHVLISFLEATTALVRLVTLKESPKILKYLFGRPQE